LATYDVRINGSARAIESSDPEQPLLYVLRGLGLTATKFVDVASASAALAPFWLTAAPCDPAC